jgi:hypothetical protein
MDHKLHIILNKADQFKRIHDFARAYGSLCWNLSKVNTRFSAPVMIIVVTTVVVLIVAIAIANQSGYSSQGPPSHIHHVPAPVLPGRLQWRPERRRAAHVRPRTGGS